MLQQGFHRQAKDNIHIIIFIDLCINQDHWTKDVSWQIKIIHNQINIKLYYCLKHDSNISIPNAERLGFGPGSSFKHSALFSLFKAKIKTVCKLKQYAVILAIQSPDSSTLNDINDETFSSDNQSRSSRTEQHASCALYIERNTKQLLSKITFKQGYRLLRFLHAAAKTKQTIFKHDDLQWYRMAGGDLN